MFFNVDAACHIKGLHDFWYVANSASSKCNAYMLDTAAIHELDFINAHTNYNESYSKHPDSHVYEFYMFYFIQTPTQLCLYVKLKLLQNTMRRHDFYTY